MGIEDYDRALKYKLGVGLEDQQYLEKIIPKNREKSWLLSMQKIMAQSGLQSINGMKMEISRKIQKGIRFDAVNLLNIYL
ncbi:hypothetical protein LEP1GSC170_1256 [Leptospira interrogans serovar Bataviae str. HAI135]|nr:hypothetical protein LEP1GSC170_1256 [Leptospira interrogans serovar Bataviae str. HAI135]